MVGEALAVGVNVAVWAATVVCVAVAVDGAVVRVGVAVAGTLVCVAVAVDWAAWVKVTWRSSNASP